MDKALKIAVLLSAVDNMSRVIDDAVGKNKGKLKQLQDAMANSATGLIKIEAGQRVLQSLNPAIDAAASFEEKMIDIRKVVQGLDSETAIADFSSQLQDLSAEIGRPIEGLADLAAAGGRMDVPKNELIAYVREVAKMSAAFDMADGEVGEYMGKLAKMFEIPISQIGKLGDAINYLDDNSIAKGAEIMEVMLRSAGTARQIGMTEQSLAALSSTFLSLGTSPQVAGTAINALIRELSIAEMQPKRFQAGLEELGISASALQKSMRIDPQGTILQVLERIKNDPNGLTLATQLFGKEYGDDISKLAGALSEYKRQLDLVNSGGATGSIDKEFEKRNQSYNAEVQKLKNVMQSIKIAIGMPIIEALKEIYRLFKPVLQSIREFLSNNPEIGKLIGLVVLLVGSFMMLSGVISVIMAVRRVMTLLNITMWMNPVVWIVAAFILAAALIYIYWKPISTFFKNTWDTIKSGLSRFVSWAQIVLSVFFNPTALIIRYWDRIKPYFVKLWERVKEIFNEFLAWVKEWPNELVKVGEAIVDNIKNGISNKWGEFKNWFKDKLQGLRDYLPFSPAKVGPLKDIHRLKFVETIASSIKPAPLVNAVRGVTAAAAVALTTPAAAGIPSRGAVAGAGATITINVPVNIAPGGQGNPESIREAVRSLMPEIESQLRAVAERRAARSY